MAKRYYLAQMIPHEPAPGWPAEWRPATVRYGDPGVVQPPQQNPDGTFQREWALVIVDQIEHAPLLRDPDIYALPEFPLHAVLNSMGSGIRNGMNQALAARGFTVNWSTSSTFADALQAIGLELEPAFDINTWDAAR